MTPLGSPPASEGYPARLEPSGTGAGVEPAERIDNLWDWTEITLDAIGERNG